MENGFDWGVGDLEKCKFHGVMGKVIQIEMSWLCEEIRQCIQCFLQGDIKMNCPLVEPMRLG